MSDREEQSGSQQEGFYANKIQIKQTDIIDRPLTTRRHKIMRQSNSFQTNCLSWTGVFSKQPIEALNVPDIIPCQQQQQQLSKIKKKSKQPIIKQHPYTLYVASQLYTQVYSRRKEAPILNTTYFIRNQVMLVHVGNQTLSAAKKIPTFQEKDQTTNLPTKPNLLKLDSRFQCGNLHCAYKNRQCQQYILFVENDTNSFGYNQWFYFSIQDIKVDVRYTFKLVNLKKKNSFFKYGAKPVVFSACQQKQTGNGWARRGQNVTYQQSPIGVPDYPQIKYYSLSFDLTFKHENDYILVAMGFPYSYTKLINLLKQISDAPQIHQNISVSINSIAKSVCNNDVPEITITSTQQNQDKKMLIFMARQHPGQVWSSYMMEGVIRYLTGMPSQSLNSSKKKQIDQDVQWLLNNYIIKIYPMINVDGVIYGNFRCDITGTDLNRKWKQTSRLLHPQVYSMKKRIRSNSKKYNIVACFDLHGHSKNYNIFCYSCRTNLTTCRILPKMLSDLNPNFYFPSCTFGISKYKESTARASIFRTIRNQNVLTIQSSFYGSKLKGQIKEFDPKDMYVMGYDIVRALKPFSDKNGRKYQQIKSQIQKNIRKYLQYDEVNLDDSGSESDPEGDQIQLEIKINQLFDSKYINQNNLEILKTQENVVEDLTRENTKQIKIDFQIVPEEVQCKKSNEELVNRNIVARSVPTIFKTIEQKQEKKRISVKKNNQLQIINLKKITKKQKQKAILEEKKKINSQNQSKLLQTNNTHKTIQPKRFIQPPKRLNVQTIKHQDQRTISTSINKRQKFRRIRPLQSLDSEIQSPFLPAQKKMQEDQSQHLKTRNNHFNITMKTSHRINSTLFEQDLYNQDQSPLLSTLFNNKRKLQEQKSKYIAQRQHSRNSRSKWVSSEKSEKMRRLFNKSGNQFATIFIDSPTKQSFF